MKKWRASRSLYGFFL